MPFGAYNADPGRLKQLRRETEKRGLDPNVWFGNVERVQRPAGQAVAAKAEVAKRK